MPKINITEQLVTKLATEPGYYNEEDVILLKDAAKRALMPHVPSTGAIRNVHGEGADGEWVANFVTWAKSYFEVEKCPGTMGCTLGCGKKEATNWCLECSAPVHQKTIDNFWKSDKPEFRAFLGRCGSCFDKRRLQWEAADSRTAKEIS